jgi:F-type H+-transporting ATPase subunit b
MEILDNATLWVGVSFVLFILLIFKPLLNSTNKSLDAKIISIKNKVEEAKKLNLESEKIYNEIEKDRIAGEIKIKTILENASRDAKNIEKKMNNNLDEIIKKKKNQLEQKLQQTKIKFEKEISSEILRTAIDVTKKRIINDLSDSKNNNLIENSIDEVNIKIN